MTERTSASLEPSTTSITPFFKNGSSMLTFSSATRLSLRALSDREVISLMISRGSVDLNRRVFMPTLKALMTTPMGNMTKMTAKVPPMTTTTEGISMNPAALPPMNMVVMTRPKAPRPNR